MYFCKTQVGCNYSKRQAMKRIVGNRIAAMCQIGTLGGPYAK